MGRTCGSLLLTPPFFIALFFWYFFKDCVWAIQFVTRRLQVWWWVRNSRITSTAVQVREKRKRTTNFIIQSEGKKRCFAQRWHWLWFSNLTDGKEMGAIAAFENYDVIRRDTILPLMKERTRLYELMGQIPWLSPSPSQANFILARVSSLLRIVCWILISRYLQVNGHSALSVRNYLRRKGILIRYFGTQVFTLHRNLLVYFSYQLAGRSAIWLHSYL